MALNFKDAVTHKIGSKIFKYAATIFMFARCISGNQTIYWSSNAQYIIRRYN